MPFAEFFFHVKLDVYQLLLDQFPYFGLVDLIKNSLYKLSSITTYNINFNIFFLFPDFLKIIRLSTHSDLDCGGFDLQIKIVQGNRSCQTDPIDDFSAGTLLEWSEQNGNLGNCKNFFVKYNPKKFFKLITSSSNDFCPKQLQLQLDRIIWYDPFWPKMYLSDPMNHWHDYSNNEWMNEFGPLKNTKLVNAKPHKEPPFYICPEDIDDLWYRSRDRSSLKTWTTSDMDNFYREIYKENCLLTCKGYLNDDLVNREIPLPCK